MTNRGQLEAWAEADPQGFLAEAKKLQKYLVTPHPAQIPILSADERFLVICAGRRFGKTKIAAKKAIRECQQGGRVVWWVANTYKNVVRGYREVLRQVPPGVLTKTPPPASVAASGRLVLNFPGGTRFEFYSGENPDAMAGEGVDYVIVDEAALQREIVWTQTIRPTLMDNNGGAMLISTPRGRNWFYHLYNRGQDPQYKGWASWRFSTADNPYIDAEEIKEMEKTLPRVMYEQEVLAEFVSDAGSVFRVKDNNIATLQEPRGHVYFGVDLAKHRDFTVFTASRASDRVPCMHDRFNAVSWPVQKQRIVQAHDDLITAGASSVTLIMDSTGIGDVIFDDLENEGLDIQPIKFTNDWKGKAVNLLAADIERGEAFLLHEQLQEFEAYTYTISEQTGRFKYSAPDSGHDDEVSAKLLEHWGHVHLGTPDIRVIEQVAETYEEVTLEPVNTADLFNNPDAWSGY
jgi:phage FluMu gp28-like protein